MEFFSVTDIGQRRQVNQDYVYASDRPVGNLPNLFVVADGMGGHNAGEFASSYVVRELVESIEENEDFNPIKIMRHGIEVANRELLNQANKSEEMRGMGTTLVVTTVVGQFAYVANVGDSRLYVGDPSLHQITRDHSLVQEMVRLGELRAEEAVHHPDKNIITRAVGVKESVDVDFFDFEVKEDGVILMCSDGLSNMVEDDEIEKILCLQGSIQEKGLELIRRANQNGGKDNIAVVLIKPFAKEVKAC